MNLKIQTRLKYLNPIAQIYLLAKQTTKVFLGGRAAGKSYTNGLSSGQKICDMPRSRGILLSTTYTQILTNTLSPMKSAWHDALDYREDIHYVVGRRPPDGFDLPFQSPDNYQNVISFWNGVIIILGSMDRPQLLRGGNNDWCMTDEALLINKPMFDEVVLYSIRGSHPSLKGKPGHLATEFTSSMPRGSVGKWLFEYELKAKQMPEHYFYIECSSYHNRKVIGEEVLAKWKREEGHTVSYQIEVLNKRIVRYGDTFYPSLAAKHWYTDSYNYNFIDHLGFEISTSVKDSRWDKDCDPNLPLHLSHDWGAFNCITIDQEDKKQNEVRFLKVMWVKHPEILDDLANKFCEYYKHHKNKVVYQWGDKSGNAKVGNAKLTNFEQFAAILVKKGWRVIRMKIGDVEHLARHTFINKLHREEDPSLPKIRHNANNCKDLQIALECARMKEDKKDKTDENKPNINQQHATHLTDAYDYRLFHGYYRKNQGRMYSSPVSFGK
jgi:hypothetical protein